MLTKLLIGILVSLHLLTPNSKLLATPQPTPAVIEFPSAGNTSNELSISDEIYADLALSHELDRVSVYYFDDNPKNTISINADRSYDPASTIKLFVAMYAFDQVAAGNISLDQMVTIEDKNVVPSQSFPNGYGPLAAGDSVSVNELLDRMITQSGNVSYNTLLDLLDRTEITKYVHDLGLVNSNVGSKLNLNSSQEAEDSQVSGFGPNTTNADDYARAFILINGQRIPGSASLFNMLSRQKFNSMLPALLPKDVIVAHKTGELDPFYHDGGIIISGNRKYILSVFSEMGTPDVVAHISDLVYTTNVNLVGNNSDIKSTSEVPNSPLDPIVSNGEPQKVMAAFAANVTSPKLTNADLGIRGSDLSLGFSTKQLPKVIIPANSPFHFLISFAERARALLNTNPSVRLQLSIENSKLDLAEANDLISKGQEHAANVILEKIGTDLENIAKDRSVSNTSSVQSSIDKVSETRFSIFAKELSGVSSDTGRVQLIKQIAQSARDTSNNIRPYLGDVAKTTSLVGQPIIGQVIRTTDTSITVRTPDSREVTTQVDNQINSRSPGQDSLKIISPNSLPVGSTIAIAGSESNEHIKPTFILTNISPEKSNQTPVTVLKVNKDKNTFVVVNQNGIPEQIDITKESVIKGSDTAVSLGDLKPGDIVVVHGESLVATPSSNLSSPNPSPLATGAAVNIGPNPTSGVSSTSTPATGGTLPTGSQGSGVPQTTVVPGKQSTPKVIKGDVIQVVQTPAKPSTNKPKKEEQEKSGSTPSPAATPETEKKH